MCRVSLHKRAGWNNIKNDHVSIMGKRLNKLNPKRKKLEHCMRKWHACENLTGEMERRDKCTSLRWCFEVLDFLIYCANRGDILHKKSLFSRIQTHASTYPHQTPLLFLLYSSQIYIPFKCLFFYMFFLSTIRSIENFILNKNNKIECIKNFININYYDFILKFLSIFFLY